MILGRLLTKAVDELSLKVDKFVETRHVEIYLKNNSNLQDTIKFHVRKILSLGGAVNFVVCCSRTYSIDFFVFKNCTAAYRASFEEFILK